MPDDHDALMQQWRENAGREAETNFRFLRSLKMVRNPERIDDQACALHEEVFGRIDCTRCANCCKTMPTTLTDADIDRIAAHLGMSREAFIETYLRRDRLEGAYATKGVPCPFLGSDDRCTIYEVRPATCQEFPHTDKEGFIWRTYAHADNTARCPAVYHIVRGLRQRRRR
jgi:Fe-S-cluster containining protein